MFTMLSALCSKRLSSVMLALCSIVSLPVAVASTDTANSSNSSFDTAHNSKFLLQQEKKQQGIPVPRAPLRVINAPTPRDTFLEVPSDYSITYPTILLDSEFAKDYNSKFYDERLRERITKQKESYQSSAVSEPQRAILQGYANTNPVSIHKASSHVSEISSSSNPQSEKRLFNKGHSQLYYEINDKLKLSIRQNLNNDTANRLVESLSYQDHLAEHSSSSMMESEHHAQQQAQREEQAQYDEQHSKLSNATKPKLSANERLQQAFDSVSQLPRSSKYQPQMPKSYPSLHISLPEDAANTEVQEAAAAKSAKDGSNQPNYMIRTTSPDGLTDAQRAEALVDAREHRKNTSPIQQSTDVIDSSYPIELPVIRRVKSSVNYTQLCSDKKSLKQGCLMRVYDSDQNLLFEANYKDGKPNGMMRGFYVSGALRSETPYVDGKIEGTQKVYSENGSVSALIPYKHGLMHGISQDFYLDGSLRQATSYVKGKKHGEERHYNLYGNLVFKIPYTKGQINGIAQSFYPDGSRQVESPYSFDKLNGIERSYSMDGKLVSEIPYTNNLMDGEVKSFYANGQLKSTHHYVNGSCEGEALSYYPSGELLYKANFKNNKLEGNTLEYYKNGQLKSSTPFVHNVMQGIGKSYYADGTLRRETPYEQEKINGTLRKYYSNGQLKEEIPQRNNILHGKYKAFARDGHLLKEITYVQNKAEGTIVYYDIKGMPLVFLEARDNKIILEESHCSNHSALTYDEVNALLMKNKLPKCSFSVNDTLRIHVHQRAHQH